MTKQEIITKIDEIIQNSTETDWSWDGENENSVTITDYYLAAQRIYDFLLEENIVALEFEPVSQFDLECRMTMEDFIDSVKTRCITDYDGFGYYGFENFKSDLQVEFNVNLITESKKIHNFTHVYWYNK